MGEKKTAAVTVIPPAPDQELEVDNGTPHTSDEANGADEDGAGLATSFNIL